ncbi:Dual 3',5'-cyclic-AMP and-GMP phosphodiesterase [Phytophthora palmivora]|uniref:Dual 3',5'-cyclic-AMP and-GMP phosphodiesterase n=1 Tax=Phytophthora palmivora TaxID=4796 RepID=A0A2P4Y7R7_9STRA|nr:Dual 3',5'-cyclic-AMP and-GMP phosphodiesterase [Phytophthora palmivora]
MNSPLSANVYSSSKKRTMQNNTNGTSPHLATLQRSRLTPLPIDTRSSVIMTDPLTDGAETRQSLLAVGDEVGAMPFNSKDPLLHEKMCQDARTISYLKNRLVQLERDVSASTKYRHMTEKQITQLSQENQRLELEKNRQQIRIGELDKTVLRQRHEYDKLAARYAAVYANLQKLLDQQQNASDTSAQHSTLQALARENQDFLRKQRVLEARHVEDKTLTSNQEKKIKRLKAEVEALQHMHEAKTREYDFNESTSDTDQVSRLTKPKKRTEGDCGQPSAPSSPVSMTSSTPRRVGSSTRAQTSAVGTGNHLVTAETYQYIDPNILKVLEKVDSQFSITNAINLSVVLKKWLNSCVHVVCSTHLPTVLQTLLKSTCELLHCEHAALFTVDHATRKLVATCSDRGSEHWELPLDKGIAGYAARHNKLCNVHCANDDPRFYSSTDSITGTASREVLALPIVHELQLYLEAHLSTNGDSNQVKVNNLGVFAVLRVWNTTHQKPFSANDQILGSLLAIQAGIILRQTAVIKTMQKINHKTHQILQMPNEIVAKASTAHHIGKPSLDATVVQLVAAAEKELAECLGIQHLRIFVLDAALHKLWHVAEKLSHDPGDNSPTAIRRYVSAQASLCALVLHGDATSIVLPQPSAEATFNDTVDIPGGARGLYLVPILSPWGNGALPFGIVQVSRVAKARLSASPFALTTSEGAGDCITTGSVADIVVKNEREAAQQTEDRLVLELLELFGRVFAGLLHHVAAQQLYDTCPPEILQAQLATLTDHLDSLAKRRQKETEDEDGDTHTADTDNTPELREFVSTTNSRQSSRHASVMVVRTTTLAPRNDRRVASADSKQRTSLESHRATSSPTTCLGQSRVASNYDTSNHNVPGTIQDGETSNECYNESGAPGGDSANVALAATSYNFEAAADTDISTNCDEMRDPETSIVETKSDEPNKLAPDQRVHDLEQQPVEADEQSFRPAVYDTTDMYSTEGASALTPEGWSTAMFDNSNYVSAEHLGAEDDVGYTWGDSDAYNPTLWHAGENVDTYEEGATWDYGAGDEEGVLATEDEDGPSKSRGDSHISTNSAYAIDLHLSSRTTSADTNQPSGAL